MISASHSDAPSFRVKENAELLGPDGYLRLNTERYGGMLCAPWLDRPLTVAGRALVRTEGGIEPRLVYVDKDLLMIPNVAIHMNREANSGMKYDPKCDMVPLMGLGGEKNAFRSLIARTAACAEEDVLGTDLFLCPREKALVWGAEDEFLSSPRLDDLQCAYGCFRGFLAAEPSESVRSTPCWTTRRWAASPARGPTAPSSATLSAGSAPPWAGTRPPRRQTASWSPPTTLTPSTPTTRSTPTPPTGPG